MNLFLERLIAGTEGRLGERQTSLGCGWYAVLDTERQPLHFLVLCHSPFCTLRRVILQSVQFKRQPINKHALRYNNEI